MSANREPSHRIVAGQPSWREDSLGSAGPWGVESASAEELARLRDTLRSIYRSLPLPLVCLAADRTITFINPAASELLGYEAGELEHLPSWLLCGSGHDAELLVPQAGEPRVPGVDGARTASLALKRKDGSEFDAEVTTFWLIPGEPAVGAPVRATPAGAPTRPPDVSVSALLVRDVSGEQRTDDPSGPASGEPPRAQPDDARRRLSRELNQGPIPDVIALVHRLHAAKRDLQDLPPEARRAVMPVIDELGLALARVATDLRGVARGLRRDTVAQHGLVAALTPLLERHGGGDAPRVELRSNVGVGARFPKHVERCLYRVAQEAASNTVRHARASALRVTLMAHEQRVELVVEDDGRGFEVPTPLASLVSERRYGLAGVAERVRSARGELEVRSSPGSGTRIRASVPIERRSHPRDL